MKTKTKIKTKTKTQDTFPFLASKSGDAIYSIGIKNVGVLRSHRTLYQYSRTKYGIYENVPLILIKKLPMRRFVEASLTHQTPRYDAAILRNCFGLKRMTRGRRELKRK